MKVIKEIENLIVLAEPFAIIYLFVLNWKIALCVTIIFCAEGITNFEK